jgi:cellulose synthase/poly-beta-1,6-N-acetylglucosamine synthase-like glycosyltransferase
MAFELVYGLLLILLLVLHAAIVLACTVGLIRSGEGLNSKQCNEFVSVIVPVRNESGNILRILEEMRQQDYPFTHMEVIVADDFSEDFTMDLAESFMKQFPGFPLVLVPSGLTGNGKSGKKQAVQRAIEVAKGGIVLCTDADTTRGPHWISSMAGSFNSETLQMVLGPVVFNKERNLLQKIQSLEFMGIMGITAGSAGLGYPVMCNGANMGYRRSAFTGTGGYSDNLQYGSGDDQFLMASVRKLYGKKAILFNRDISAIVGTEAEATLTGFMNQRIRWVSKSRGYSDPMVIGVGMVTWLVNLLLLGGIVAGLFYPRILVLSIVLWLVKILLEYPLVRRMIRFFGKRKLLVYYAIAQVFQLVYVVFAGLLGVFMPYRWKGRMMRR